MGLTAPDHEGTAPVAGPEGERPAAIRLGSVHSEALPP